MRSIVLFALLALPALAQAPRSIAFKCEEGLCYLAESDWKWLMESTLRKDAMIARCYKDS